ncbi:hypothetical protein CRUP_015847 [Coryphaenoides rupestris]|nr:hypothetical protein CRUP_015847 [Coryphaenoides rupestris]
MDSGEGGGDGGGGEERDAAAAAADLHPQPLSPPLLIPEVIPEQGSSSHTSAVDPAKEPLAVPHPRPEGAEGSPARERTQGGAAGAGWGGGGHLQGIGGCQEQGMKEEEGRREGCLFELGTESEEEHASAGEEEHLSCTPSSAAALPSETEVRDIKGDRGWISGFPLSFKSQQSASASPPTRPSEDDRPAGVPRSSFANEGGAKAPEPNVSQPEREVEEEEEDGDGGGGGSDGGDRAVLRSLNHDLSPGSLTSHMTIMHSRNSCKTLKCPKCNWHYKSQHTLQLHMREKHPETSGPCVCSGGGSGGKCVCGGGAAGGACAYCSSGKAHPRLARGETYACGYKPYRCEVCDYATSSKGNLSIHMQSDKHLNNVQSGGHANGGGGGVVVSQSHSPDEQVYKLALPLHAPSASQPAKQASPPAPQQAHSLGKRWRCDVCDYETSIARNLRIHTTSEKHTHNMLRLQRGFYLSHCRSLPPGLKHLQSPGGELPLGLHASGQAIPEASLATLGSTLTPSPSPSPSPPLAPPLSPTGALSPGVFHCLVCSGFSSDSLESVEQHLGAPRSLPQAEWCSLVAGGCHCRLCAYTTPLRANFSLHCQTDRHRARYQLAAHLREGGDRAPEEVAAMVAKGNPVQLRCNLCDYVTSSLEKLRGHALSAHHEASVRVYRQYDGDVDGGAWLFHCLLCSHSCSSKVQLLKHSQTATHQQREGLLQLQPMGGEELAAIFTIRKSPDGVRGDTRGMERDRRNATPPAKRPSSGCEETESPHSPKRPRTHQQNENQQTAQCPLCQVMLPFATLRHHLTYLHSVAQDCVDKLISAVAPSVEQLETKPQMDYGESRENKEATPKDVTALLTPPLEEPTSHPSNSRPSPPSPSHHPPSSPPNSPPSDPPPPSDRHGYRFRCSRCSLAFPTHEKLQLHWQYHAMRAATECPLCARRCRSQEALQRHMQNTHAQLDSAIPQNAHLTSHTAQAQLEQTSAEQDIRLSPQAAEEADEEEEDDMEAEALVMEKKDVKTEERKMEGKEAQLQQPLPLLVSGCLAVFQQLDLRGAGVAAQEAVEEPRPSINIAIVLLEKLNHRNKSHVRKARNTDAHAGLMMSAERVSSELLQAAGHVVAQVASQLHRVALGDHGGHLLWGPVSSQLVPGAVPWQPPATREHHSAWGRERGAPRCCSTDSRLSEEKPEQTRQWKTPGERAPVGDRGGASGGEGEGDGEGVFEAWRQAPAVGQVAGDAGLVVAHVTSPPLAEGVGLLRRWRRGLLGGLAGGWSVQRQCQFVDLLVRRVALGDHHTAAAAICMASTLHVVEVFVRLHVDAEVAFGRGGIVAHLAAVSPRAKRGWALPELQYAHAPPAAPPPHTHFPPEPPPEHTHGPLVSGCFSRMCSCRRSWLRLLRTALSPPSLPPPPPSPSSSSSSTSLSGWLTFGSGALAPPSLAKEERGTPAGLSSSLGLVGGEAEADCWDLKLKGKPEIQPRSPLMAAAEEGVQERCFGGEGERGGGRRSGGEQGFGRAVALPSSVPLGAARRYMAHIGALMNRKAERQKE